MAAAELAAEDKRVAAEDEEPRPESASAAPDGVVPGADDDADEPVNKKRRIDEDGEDGGEGDDEEPKKKAKNAPWTRPEIEALFEVNPCTVSFVWSRGLVLTITSCVTGSLLVRGHARPSQQTAQHESAAVGRVAHD